MSEGSKADDALLARTANTVFGRKGELKSLAMMPHPRRVFAMIYSAQGTIDNGGFQYFFECDWPGTRRGSLVLTRWGLYRAVHPRSVAICGSA